MSRAPMTEFEPEHFAWSVDDRVATITLNRPERKNPLTLQSYAELRDTFRQLVYEDTVKAVVITGAGGNFCSGGDVHEIIGPLVEMKQAGRMDPGFILRHRGVASNGIKRCGACKYKKLYRLKNRGRHPLGFRFGAPNEIETDEREIHGQQIALPAP